MLSIAIKEINLSNMTQKLMVFIEIIETLFFSNKLYF